MLFRYRHLEERGINFEGIAVDKVVDFLFHTCKNRLYRVDEVPIENGAILYLAGDALGEKAYYLLTAVVKEYDSVTQVLLRANSDKRHGLNGFLNEILDNLRHLVLSAEAREIGIIKKEQVINIIDSVVQRTTFAGGEGAASVNIEGSVVQRTEIKEDAEEKRRAREEAERKERERARQEEERLQKEEEERKTREEAEKREREEQEKLRREREEQQRKEKREQERIQREEEEEKERERKARAEQDKKAREEAEREEREEDERRRREEGGRKAREAAEQREKERASQEVRLGMERERRAAEDQGVSQKKIMAVVLALGVLLIGFWMLAPGSNDAPPPSETVPLPTRTATPDASRDSEVAQAVSQTPTPAVDQEATVTNSIGMEFVLIPAGEFDMGSPSDEYGRYSNEGPVHHVTIEKAFYMGRYEVTQKEWQEVMGNNPSLFKGDDLPVEQVSWNDVQEFIKKLNEKEGTDKYRLPSEAEWEYACRAGTTTRYSFGDSESKLGDYAWYGDNSGVKTHPVGRSPILMDCMTCTAMSGNGHRTDGTVTTTARQPMAARGKAEMAPTGSFGAAAGASMPGTADRRSASTTARATAATTSAFGFSRRRSHFPPYPFTTYMLHTLTCHNHVALARRLCVRSRTAGGARRARKNSR